MRVRATEVVLGVHSMRLPPLVVAAINAGEWPTPVLHFHARSRQLFAADGERDDSALDLTIVQQILNVLNTHNTHGDVATDMENDVDLDNLDDDKAAAVPSADEPACKVRRIDDIGKDRNSPDSPNNGRATASTATASAAAAAETTLAATQQRQQHM